jgi:spore maturation protein CgeB
MRGAAGDIASIGPLFEMASCSSPFLSAYPISATDMTVQQMDMVSLQSGKDTLRQFDVYYEPFVI